MITYFNISANGKAKIHILKMSFNHETLVRLVFASSFSRIQSSFFRFKIDANHISFSTILDWSTNYERFELTLLDTDRDSTIHLLIPLKTLIRLTSFDWHFLNMTFRLAKSLRSWDPETVILARERALSGRKGTPLNRQQTLSGSVDFFRPAEGLVRPAKRSSGW